MQGIIFKPDMIKAIAEDRKIVTRRVIIPQPGNKLWREIFPSGIVGWKSNRKHQFGNSTAHFPKYQVGEVVYIKEAWATENQYNHLKPTDIPHTAKIFFAWEGNGWWYDPFTMGKLRSPMFMLQWAARYFIKIIDVRAERLQEITEEDALAEGMTGRLYQKETNSLLTCGQDVFQWYWNSIKPKYPWADNPWIWRYEFEKGEKNDSVNLG